MKSRQTVTVESLLQRTWGSRQREKQVSNLHSVLTCRKEDTLKTLHNVSYEVRLSLSNNSNSSRTKGSFKWNKRWPWIVAGASITAHGSLSYLYACSSSKTCFHSWQQDWEAAVLLPASTSTRPSCIAHMCLIQPSLLSADFQTK